MEPCCALKYYPAVEVCQNEKVPTPRHRDEYTKTRFNLFLVGQNEKVPTPRPIHKHTVLFMVVFGSRVFLSLIKSTSDHYHDPKLRKDGDVETKRRALEQAEEEDFGNSKKGLVLLLEDHHDYDDDGDEGDDDDGNKNQKMV